MPHALATIIDAAFEDRANITPKTNGDIRQAVEAALHLLDAGKARVAEKIPGKTGPDSWTVNQWLKKAVLLSFRLNDMHRHSRRRLTARPGVTRFPPNSTAGAPRTMSPPAFAPCPAASSAAPPISRPASS